MSASDLHFELRQAEGEVVMRAGREPQMLLPCKRTQFAGIITLSRLHLDCHYFPLGSIQSAFTVWLVSSFPSTAYFIFFFLDFIIIVFNCFNFFAVQHSVVIWYNPHATKMTTCYLEVCGLCWKKGLNCNVSWELYLMIQL